MLSPVDCRGIHAIEILRQPFDRPVCPRRAGPRVAGLPPPVTILDASSARLPLTRARTVVRDCDVAIQSEDGARREKAEQRILGGAGSALS